MQLIFRHLRSEYRTEASDTSKYEQLLRLFLQTVFIFTILSVFLYRKFNNMKAMKTATKPKEVPVKQVMRAPEGRPKVKFGTMRHIAYISDTLFDDDLK
jgi:hypothetical protein